MNDDFIEQVQRAAAGDAAAFGVLYEQVYTDLYRYALYALGSREEAEDAVQETALEAFRGLHGLRQPDAFRGWMFTILAARCNRHIRGLIRRREETDLDACPWPARISPATGTPPSGCGPPLPTWGRKIGGWCSCRWWAAIPAKRSPPCSGGRRGLCAPACTGR